MRNKLLANYLRNRSNELATVRISAFCVAMLSNNSSFANIISFSESTNYRRQFYKIGWQKRKSSSYSQAGMLGMLSALSFCRIHLMLFRILRPDIAFFFVYLCRKYCVLIVNFEKWCIFAAFKIVSIGFIIKILGFKSIKVFGPLLFMG